MKYEKLKSRFFLSIVVASLMLNTACSFKQVSTAIQVSGTVCFILAMILYPLRRKIAHLLKSFGKSKHSKLLLILAVSLLFFIPGKMLHAQGAASITFAPAVDTFKEILCNFSSITAGACGFYGLTRVGWLLVNEERSAGTSLFLAVIGFVVATIAVGLLQFNSY